MTRSLALLALTFAGPILALPVAAPSGGENGQYDRPANEGAYSRPPNEGAYTWQAAPSSSIIGTPAAPSVNPDIPVPNPNQEPIGGGSPTPANPTPTATITATSTGVVPSPPPGGEGKPAGSSTSESGSKETPSTGGGGGSGGAAKQGKGTMFKGDGSVESGWPSEKEWLSFDDLWKNNQYALTKGCQPNTVSPGATVIQNKPKEIEDIKSAIKSVSQETGVDDRYILVAILQESNGCVRVKGTVSPGVPVKNPGIMQSHEGENSCADVGEADCPTDKIKGMVMDGTAGTKAGDGLKQLMSKAKELHKATEMSMQAYVAMRLYNSGENSLVESNDLSVGGATSSYSSDIANRLIGYVF
ncbi:hypothetical protein M7I_1649 [Glarea lozoyensis 74030]|nr:hypothetical protein M7I_1649 [Glarea lozoyensis 74030]